IPFVHRGTGGSRRIRHRARTTSAERHDMFISRTPRGLAVALCAAVISGLATAQYAFVNWESPHVHPLDLAPGGARLLAVNTPDARLEVFDMGGALPVLLAQI